MRCPQKTSGRCAPVVFYVMIAAVLGPFFAPATYAQSAKPSAQLQPPAKYSAPPVQWDLKTGEPIRLKFHDGRELVFKQSLLRPEWVSIPFTIYENTCQPQNIGQKGEHRIQILIVKVALVWSQHPDASKIGQTVKVKNPDGGFAPLDTTDFLPPTAFGRMPELSAQTESEEIQMEDFSWIPSHGLAAAPEELFVVRWEGEFMIDNAETSAPENRPIQGYAGVHLQKTSDRVLKITRIDQLLALFSNAFPFGDVVSMSIYDQKRTLCQVASKVDQGPLVREIRRLQAERTSVDQTLVYGRDSILSLWQSLESFQLMTLSPERLYSTLTETTNGVTTTHFVLTEVE